jgi:Domain of unknown function (DUF4166)
MPTCSEVPPDNVTPLPTGSLAQASRLGSPGTLYRQLLGSSWLQLSEPVRFAHSTESTVRASGRLRVAHGRSRVARVLARLLRLPRASDAADTRLVVTSGANGERWRRTFDARPLDTRQYRAAESELAERIGLLELRFRLEASHGSLLYRQVEAAFLAGPVRLRLPATCAPRVDAREDPAGARRIRVHVGVVFPGLGSVLTYDGLIDIEETPA